MNADGEASQTDRANMRQVLQNHFGALRLSLTDMGPRLTVRDVHTMEAAVNREMAILAAELGAPEPICRFYEGDRNEITFTVRKRERSRGGRS